MPINNLMEYSLKYSERTGSLWFYSKDLTTNFNADTSSNNDFKSFNYKAELLGNTAADEVNGVLKNAAIAALLKYLSNFWRSKWHQLIAK